MRRTVPTCTCCEIDGEWDRDDCDAHGAVYEDDDYEDPDDYEDLVADWEMGVGW